MESTRRACQARICAVLTRRSGNIGRVSSRRSQPDVWLFQRGNDGGVGAMVIAAVVIGLLAITGNEWWWHIVGATFAAGFAIGAWRYGAILLAAGPHGVLVQNSIRGWSFGWDEVAGFESGSSLSATGSGAAIRVLRHDGMGVTAMAGSRLNTAEVERDVAWLNDYRVKQLRA